MSETAQAVNIGPVDVAVIVFPGNKFNGDVAPAIADLQDEGVVRIIDLAFVVKEEDGSTAAVEVGDADVSDAFERITGHPMELLSEEDLDQVAADLEPNSSALVIVWENTWAARLAGAVGASQGRLVGLERIPRAVVLAALEALEEE